MSTVAIWKCRAKGCEFTYPDPIGHTAVGHKCPARGGLYTQCRRVKRTGDAGKGGG